MDLLLDTHAWLWWTTADPLLSSPARSAIADPANTVYFSVVSSWEIAIKFSLGKITLAATPENFIPPLLSTQGFRILDVKLSHTLGVMALPYHHKDPFDRLLVAQAIYENLTLVSHDSTFSAYGISSIW